MVLAAGENPLILFPRPFDKPKCLYSYRNRIQLDRVVEAARQVVPESDIRVVVGYKAAHIRRFVRQRGWSLEIVENPEYRQSALLSLRTGLSGLNEDVLLLMADELVSLTNLRRLAEAQAGLAVLVSSGYPYYFFGAFRIGRNQLAAWMDERYLSGTFLEEVRDFLRVSDERLSEGERREAAYFHDDVNLTLDIGTGYAMGWMALDLIRRTGRLAHVERLVSSPELTTLPFDSATEYVKDLDSFDLTDEYRLNRPLRVYMNILKALGMSRRAVASWWARR